MLREDVSAVCVDEQVSEIDTATEHQKAENAPQNEVEPIAKRVSLLDGALEVTFIGTILSTLDGGLRREEVSRLSLPFLIKPVIVDRSQLLQCFLVTNMLLLV